VLANCHSLEAGHQSAVSDVNLDRSLGPIATASETKGADSAFYLSKQHCNSHGWFHSR